MTETIAGQYGTHFRDQRGLSRSRGEEPGKLSRTVPTVPRKPGDDDDIPTDPAWLAEFNARIGRPGAAE